MTMSTVEVVRYILPSRPEPLRLTNRFRTRVRLPSIIRFRSWPLAFPGVLEIAWGIALDETINKRDAPVSQPPGLCGRGDTRAGSHMWLLRSRLHSILPYACRSNGLIWHSVTWC